MFNVGDRVIYVGSHDDLKNAEGIVAEICDKTVSVDLDSFVPRVYFHTSSVEQLLIKLNREPDWEV